MGVRARFSPRRTGKIDIHEDIREEKADSFWTALDDQGINELIFTVFKIFQEPVAVPLLSDIVGICQGAGDNRVEILAPLLGKGGLFASVDGVKLVLHDQIEQSADRRSDRGIMRYAKTAVGPGGCQGFAAGDLLALSGVLEEIVVFAMDQTVF